MTDLGPTDTSTTTLAANQFPVSAAWVPNQALTPVEGIAVNTDSGSKKSTAIRLGLKDGDDVTQGSSGDANTVNSVMGRLTKIRDLLNASLAVTQSGTWNITNISGTVSLPTGASTSAKQPAPGTAGSASADVITVQGIASMTALKVDGSGFTQPVSGTVAATQSGTWTVQPGNTANTTAWKVDGSAVTQPVSGTVSINAIPTGSNLIGSVEVVDSGGTNKGAIDAAGNQQVKGGFSEQSGLSAGALNADLLPSIDVSAYSWVSIHVTAIATGGTLTFQASNDNFATQVESVNLARISSSTSNTSTAATTGLWAGACNFRYFRIRQTAWTSGSSTGVVEFYTVPKAFNNLPVGATQAGTWTVQPGNTANTTAWKVDGSAVNQPIIGTKTNNSATPGSNNVGALIGIANAAAPTLTEGDQVLLSTDLSGSQRTTVTNANVNGQSTMVNSAPIVIASDQTVIPTETWMMNQIKAGKGFMTGPNSTLATSTNASLTVLALSLFNPSLTKNVLIYSIELFTTENKGASANLIRTLTTDPGNGTGMTNALTVTNLKLGGSATAGVTAWTSPNGITASITPPGTAAWQIPSGGTQPSVDELLTNGTVILLPAGANNGIAVTTVVSVAADGFSCMAKWIEY